MILLDTSVVSAVLRRRRRGPGEEATARKVASLDQDFDAPTALARLKLLAQ